MKRICLIFITVSAVFAGRAVLANGGGYDFGVKFTGALAPFQASGTENVQILDEKLDIELRGTEAAVIVRYTMRNLSKDPVTVKFGFPVEAQKTGDEEELEEPTDPASRPPVDEKQQLIAAIQQLKGYTVKMNGQAVPAELLIEPFASGKIKPFPGSNALKNVAGWMVSEVVFPGAASSPLEIRYTADYQGDSTYVSDDDRASPLAFQYRLSTGAVWNGPIGTGTVTLKVDGIPSSEVEILKPDHRFKRRGDDWIWAFSDLEPTLADDISINAVPGWKSFGGSSRFAEGSQSLAYLERLAKWGEGHQRFTAVASSTLTPKVGHSYGPENLTKGYESVEVGATERAWCEGVKGLGVGEYVELKPLKPNRMMAIGFLSGIGDPNKDKLFKRNARPSRVEIVLNGDRRFSATLGDTMGEQLIPITDYAKAVSTIRIIIKDAYPGTQYQDTCISKVILYDLLAKHPDVRPAR